MDDYEKLKIEAWIQAYVAAIRTNVDRETAYIMGDNCIEAMDERFTPSIKGPTGCTWVWVQGGSKKWFSECGSSFDDSKQNLTRIKCPECGGAVLHKDAEQVREEMEKLVDEDKCLWVLSGHLLPHPNPYWNTSCEQKAPVTGDNASGDKCYHCKRTLELVNEASVPEPEVETCTWAFDPDRIIQTDTACGRSVHPLHRVVDGTCLYCERPIRWEGRIKREEPEAEVENCVWTKPPGKYSYIKTSCGRQHHPHSDIPANCPNCHKSITLAVEGVSKDVPIERLLAYDKCVWSHDNREREWRSSCGSRVTDKLAVPANCPSCKRPAEEARWGATAEEAEQLPYCTWRECAISGIKSGQCGATEPTPAAMPTQCPGCARPVAVGLRLNEEKS